MAPGSLAKLLLALAFLLQSGLGLAQCLRLSPATPGFQMEICTPEGLVRIDLDGEGQADPAPRPPDCALCLTPAAAPGGTGPLPAPPGFVLAAGVTVMPAPAPTPRAEAAHRPRGPPAAA